MSTNTVDRSLELGRESSRSLDMYILHAYGIHKSREQYILSL